MSNFDAQSKFVRTNSGNKSMPAVVEIGTIVSAVFLGLIAMIMIFKLVDSIFGFNITEGLNDSRPQRENDHIRSQSDDTFPIYDTEDLEVFAVQDELLADIEQEHNGMIDDGNVMTFGAGLASGSGYGRFRENNPADMYGNEQTIRTSAIVMPTTDRGARVGNPYQVQHLTIADVTGPGLDAMNEDLDWILALAIETNYEENRPGRDRRRTFKPAKKINNEKIAKAIRSGNNEKINKVVPAKVDRQNVHDSSVVKSVAKGYDKIISNGRRYAVGEQRTIDAINEYIKQYTPVDGVGNLNTKRVQCTLDTIKKRNTPMLNFRNDRELTILSNVWGAANDPKLSERDSALRKEAVLKQLEDSARSSATKTECATGRMSRLVDSFSGMSLSDDYGNADENQVKIIPDWQVKRELMAKSASIVSELESSTDPATKTAFDAAKPNATELRLVNEFSKNLQQTVRKRLTEEYVDSGNITQQQFNKNTQWISSL